MASSPHECPTYAFCHLHRITVWMKYCSIAFIFRPFYSEDRGRYLILVISFCSHVSTVAAFTAYVFGNTADLHMLHSFTDRSFSNLSACHMYLCVAQPSSSAEGKQLLQSYYYNGRIPSSERDIRQVIGPVEQHINTPVESSTRSLSWSLDTSSCCTVLILTSLTASSPTCNQAFPLPLSPILHSNLARRPYSAHCPQIRLVE